jgi:histidinol dehydrogenase
MQLIRYPDQVQEVRRIFDRTATDISKVRPAVRQILEDVRQRGDAAIIDYHRRYDGAELRPSDLRVPAEQLASSYEALPGQLREALRARADNLRVLHSRQQITPVTVAVDGITAGELVRPVESAGLYIPGGTAPFPTVMQTLAMTAAIARVPRIVACLPPTGLTDAVLAAAYLSGVTEVYQAGGVAAIAALAYGTETIAPVRLISGPGNLYVTAAKLEVYGEVAIDMPAGPSEAVILCEDSADPEWVAADVLARAEHDPHAAGVVVTWSAKLAEAVDRHVHAMAPQCERSKVIEESLARSSAIVLTKDRADAIAFTNQYAPEHLEILADNAEDYLRHITHAGSIFLGHHTPVAVGDYLGISNHILPTSGYAKSFSPVSVRTFQRVMQYERISPSSLRKYNERIMLPLAEAEGLGAHAGSLAIRTRLAEASPASRAERPGRQQRRFKLGVYFDLYSGSLAHWRQEAEFNRQLRPEMVEILLEHPGSSSELTPERADLLRGLIGDVPITVHAPTLTLSLASMSSPIVEATQRELVAALGACQNLGADMMTIHAGEYPYYTRLNGTDPAELFIKNVQPVLEEAAARDITVCVENLQTENHYPHSLEEVGSILSPTPGLMFAHDLRNFCAVGEDPEEAFAKYAGRTRSIHHRIDCGLDEAGLRDFLAGLIEYGFTGNFIVEDKALLGAEKEDKTQLIEGWALVAGILADLRR